MSSVHKLYRDEVFPDEIGDVKYRHKWHAQFEEDQIFCIFDFETYSEADLKKVGGYEYSKHPSTEILCVSWCTGTRDNIHKAKIQTWAPYNEGDIEPVGGIDDFLQVLDDPDVILVAHNALFEKLITSHVLPRYVKSKRTQKKLHDIPSERFICTATLVAALGLPRRLEYASIALKIPFLKDMLGHKMMLKYCKPRKPSKRNPSTRHADPDEFKLVLKYCRGDIRAEREIFIRVPPLVWSERMLWLLDQRINLRGFKVDRELVNTTLGLIEKEVAELDRRTESATYGALSTAHQRDALLEWLESEGVFLPNLQRKTVEQAVKGGLVDGNTKKVLELRLAISKISTAKYRGLESRSRTDGRLRDILMFYGAATGRWGGVGVQPHNFPRPFGVKNTLQAARILSRGDLELIRVLYGEPMNIFSSCLRNMIVAGEGKTLDVGDFSAIEARVLFWVAKHEKGVDAFRSGAKMYEALAQKIFNVKRIEDVTEDQRFVGKQATLGCGYMMGWGKFITTCAQFNKAIPAKLAKAAVATYRKEHKPVVKLWSNIERAAIAAVRKPGTRFTINRTTWYVKKNVLYCELPSGRCIAYFKPRIRMGRTPWGDKRKQLTYWGADQKTKRWTLQRTYGGKLVENVVQAISRDIMAAAMLRIEDTKIWQVVLTVHDEILAERKLMGPGCKDEFLELMAAAPDWAKDCPIKVEGWEGLRYRK